MKIRHFFLPAIVTGVFCTAPFALAGRGDYETPGYEVVTSDGAFEVRDYPEMVVATAPMNSDDGKRNSAFMKLFGYISGKNETEQKIAMTTPVISSGDKGKESMSFVVPSAVARTGAPGAENPEIVIHKRSAGRFAAYRYSGRWTGKNEAAATDRLMKWVKERDLKIDGSVERASYDPPFTLPALRRNEVMVRILK